MFLSKRELSDNNFTKFGLDIKLGTTLVAVIIMFLYFMYLLLKGDVAYEQAANVQNLIVTNLSLIFVVVLIFSIVLLVFFAIYKKTANVRIGGSNCKPEYSKGAWYAMLFSAGVGIGLIFYGAYEPLAHMDAPFFEFASPEVRGITTSVFHWAFGFAFYGIIALGLAYFTYNKGLPMAPRSLFYPLLKDKIYGFIGDIIDATAMIASLFGLASSLGIGAIQINAGFNYLFGVEINSTFQVILIIFITFFATLSAITGLKKGVRILSELNMYLCGAILIVTILASPILIVFANMILTTFTHVVGAFDAYVLTTTKDPSFLSAWTIFYWAWWSAWAIFVGSFIAKVSKGRTIREFVIAVLIVPLVVATVWFVVFGTAGQYIAETIPGAGADILETTELTLFKLNGYLYSNKIILYAVNILTILLIFSFFVTSSDSGSIVVDGLANGGKLKSPRKQKIFWASMEGLLAISLILIGGRETLGFLQSSLIIIGLPFTIAIFVSGVLLLYQLLKDLKNKETEVEFK